MSLDLYLLKMTGARLNCIQNWAPVLQVIFGFLSLIVIEMLLMLLFQNSTEPGKDPSFSDAWIRTASEV